jgi:hypothetical protein
MTTTALIDEEGVAEQRRSPRRSRTHEVWIETVHGEVYGSSILDVSDGGVGLASFGVPVQIGDIVRICLAQSSAMDEGWIEVKVRWRSAKRLGVVVLHPHGRRALKFATRA